MVYTQEAGRNKTGISHEQPRGRVCLFLSLRHKPVIKPALGSVDCLGLCVGSFLVLYIYLGNGWEAPHAGLRTHPSPRPAAPSCSICVQRAKCPPFPQ